MAYDDIQVFSNPAGSNWVLHYEFETGGTFSKGDVVSIDQDGQVTEGADELVAEDILGIAMAGPIGASGVAINNPRTNAAYADGDLFPVLIPQQSTLFITQNITTDGTTYNNAVPGIANIGDVISLCLISGVWGIQLGGTAAAAVGHLVDILDVRKQSIFHGTTNITLVTTDVYYGLFTIQAHHHSTAASTAMIGATA